MGLLIFNLLIATALVAFALFSSKVVEILPNEVGGRPKAMIGAMGRFIRVVAIALAVFIIFKSTSFVIIDSDKTGHLKKVFLGGDLAPGKIIAANGEMGPQARILPPGFHFIPFLKVLYEVEELPIIEVPEGGYGFIVAKDGRPLGENQLLASAWPDERIEEMLNPEMFINGSDKIPPGQKGPQATVLKPGKYRINHYLFEVRTKGDEFRATDIPAGFVGVIKSNINTKSLADCQPIVMEDRSLTVPLVPKGCRGVWNDVFLPGRYYLNKKAYEMHLVDTRVQRWEYAGGYTRRYIDLKVRQDGSIEQTERKEVIPVPEFAAADAVILRVEGWEVPQEIRILAQVKPEDAPFVVASVGGLKEVEQKIITPKVRSIVRNVTGSNVESHPGKAEKGDVRQVLDLQDRRQQLEDAVLEAIQVEAEKTGVTVTEIRFGDPVIPPELLVARRREQLATQMEQTYTQERIAQEKRIQSEKSKAEADQQGTLMKAEIERKAAQFQKEALKLMGEGEQARLRAIADGQKAQAQVLGPERTMQLAIVKEVLAAAMANPEIVKVPRILVRGGDGGGSLEGAFAILGDSNISRMSDMADMSVDMAEKEAKKLIERKREEIRNRPPQE
ncbi:MAG: SPFH domain-containing protein [Nitrospinota bacterium]|nr:SPFH domain-containing protein [Nitrospinota bacterium]